MAKSTRKDKVSLSALGSNSAFKEIKDALRKRKENADLNNNGVICMVEGYFIELGSIYANSLKI